jgi:DNA-binding MarR family transcriptional regulator
MNQQQILSVAKQSGILISNRDEFLKAVTKFARSFIPKPMTRTQMTYLAALDDWMSLNDLANKFGCTSQNALKMIRALEARKLITKEKLYRKTWAFYYKRK